MKAETAPPEQVIHLHDCSDFLLCRSSEPEISIVLLVFRDGTAAQDSPSAWPQFVDAEQGLRPTEV